MKEVFVPEPEKHGSVSSCFLGGKKLRQGQLYMHTARALEQNGVSGLGQRAHQLARWDRIVEKKRGVGPKAGSLGGVQHVTSRAA